MTNRIVSRAIAAAAVAALAATSAPAHAESSSTGGSSFGAKQPGEPFNDPDCTPSAEHPYPVVFLHGTSADADQFSKSAQQLADTGYCTYALNYGRETSTIQAAIPTLFGTADLKSSSEEVADFIDSVLDDTGAEKVDIVAHSQGGLHTKAYIADGDNAANVNRVVTLGANLHGTTLNGQSEFLASIVKVMPTIAAFFASTAAIQQLAGSTTMQHYNELPDTAAGVTYTSLYSPSDTTVTPNTASQFEAVEGANVANIDAEAACGTTPLLHPDMPKNATMAALTKWGLERDADEKLPTQEACAS